MVELRHYTFSKKGTFASFGSDSENGFKVHVQSIDETPVCSDATFIKMDIEGAELYALEGAKETILRNHPKMAMCLYHSVEDYIRIIEWINALDMDYNFYIRHHSFDLPETVLYAL